MVANRNYPLDAWYQAAWSHEIAPGATLLRTLLDLPVLMLRAADGTASAVLDRCPHRFAPLSLGNFDGQTLACGYHGLQFGLDGACRHNPHGPLATHARLRSFPLVEKYDRLWIWPGRAEAADPALLPDLDAVHAPPATARSTHYMSMAANWLLIIENLIELSHADYIHPALGGFVTHADAKWEEKPHGVQSRWNAAAVDPPPVFQPWVPAGSKADIWLDADWIEPAFVVIDTGATPADVPPDRKMWSLHGVTPETADKTHYFFAFARDFLVEDQAWTAMMGEMGEKAFTNEDKPMIEGQQARIGDTGFMALRPALLGVDRAAVAARRAIQRKVDAECEFAA